MNYLQDHLDTVQPRMETNLKQMSHLVDREQALFELRTTICSASRQYGATRALAEIFNPNTDLFVGMNLRMVEDFQRRLGHKKFLYSTINTVNTDGLRGRQEVKSMTRIFMDVSMSSMLGRNTKIVRRTMQMLDEFMALLGNPNVIFVVV
ncbi:hypothetical protein Acj133p134 [Acinetobacter phage 133]|uniref:Uncharacterized protein n=1 Tax=Acinetobacter phage 133 TaxID=2919552 RepID=D9I668_9CAUD|nr:hypothetical protein Acj133p134 [Acinetobacter phage 133]ADJ19449.1 hypothetical protein Acj133p134 [Acinetobacter phage 133]